MYLAQGKRSSRRTLQVGYAEGPPTPGLTLSALPHLGLLHVEATGAKALLAICDSRFTCEDYNTYRAHPWRPFSLRRAHQGLGPHTHLGLPQGRPFRLLAHLSALQRLNPPTPRLVISVIRPLAS